MQTTAETTAAAAPTHAALPDGFDAFWQAYPRRTGLAQALAAWQRLNPSPEQQRAIAQAARQAADHARQRDPGLRFTPPPATWLGTRRWNDLSVPAGSLSPTSLLSPLAQPQATGTPQKQTHACGRAHQCRDGQPLATMRQRAARLAQTALRRFGISVSWAPSCGGVGCVDGTSLATGMGAHPSTTNTPAN